MAGEHMEGLGLKLAHKALGFWKGLETGTPDPDEAIVWYERAVKFGSLLAMNSLGAVYLERKDYENAYHWFLEAAMKGEADSLYHLGEMYYNGDYVHQDTDKAFSFFERAYRGGVKNACFYMGCYAEYGLSGKQDMEKALAYYREGVQWGCAGCAAGLGRCCSLGKGVPRDEEKGREYMRLARWWGYRETPELKEKEAEANGG